MVAREAARPRVRDRLLRNRPPISPPSLRVRRPRPHIFSSLARVAGGVEIGEAFVLGT
jgi:hypothetical protein